MNIPLRHFLVCLVAFVLFYPQFSFGQVNYSSSVDTIYENVKKKVDARISTERATKKAADLVKAKKLAEEINALNDEITENERKLTDISTGKTQKDEKTPDKLEIEGRILIDKKLVKIKTEEIRDLISKSKVSEINDDASKKAQLEKVLKGFGVNDSTFLSGRILYVYDFKKKEFYKIVKDKRGLTYDPVNFNKEHISARKDVGFKIIHVNRFVYDVSVADSLVSYDTKPSPLLNDFFFGDSTKMLGDLMKQYKSAIKPSASSNRFLKQNKSFDEYAGDDLTAALSAFLKTYHLLKNYLVQATYAYPDLNRSDKDTIAPEIDLLLDKLNEVNKNVVALDQQYEINYMKYQTLKSQYTSYLKFQPEYKALRNAIMEADDELEKTNARQNKQLSDAQNKVYTDQINSIQARIKSLQTRLDTVKNYLGVETEAKMMHDLDSQKVEIFPYLLAKALQKLLPNESDLRKAMSFFHNLDNFSQEFSIDHINLRNGNALELYVEIKTKDSSFQKVRIPPVDYKLNIEIPLTGNAYLNFSTGSFIGYGTYLRSKTYSWQNLPGNNGTITGNDGYILIESGYTSIPTGFSALMNIEWKLGSPTLGLGISGGVGLTMESTPRLAYLGGGSIFIGYKRQLALTIGMAAMQVDVISNDMQAVLNKTIYTQSPKPTIDTYKEMKVGPFISLSYIIPLTIRKGRISGYPAMNSSAQNANTDTKPAPKPAIAPAAPETPTKGASTPGATGTTPSPAGNGNGTNGNTSTPVKP